MRQAASLLGSNLSPRPLIFNAGVIATGLATLLAVPGFFVAFQNVGEPVHELDHMPGTCGERDLEPVGRLLPLARSEARRSPCPALCHDRAAVSLDRHTLEKNDAWLLKAYLAQR